MSVPKGEQNSWTEYYELFDGKPCQSLSVAKA